jgi:hypothetical protein
MCGTFYSLFIDSQSIQPNALLTYSFVPSWTVSLFCCNLQVYEDVTRRGTGRQPAVHLGWWMYPDLYLPTARRINQSATYLFSARSSSSAHSSTGIAAMSTRKYFMYFRTYPVAEESSSCKAGFTPKQQATRNLHQATGDTRYNIACIFATRQ